MFKGKAENMVYARTVRVFGQSLQVKRIIYTRTVTDLGPISDQYHTMPEKISDVFKKILIFIHIEYLSPFCGNFVIVLT